MEGHEEISIQSWATPLRLLPMRLRAYRYSAVSWDTASDK